MTGALPMRTIADPGDWRATFVEQVGLVGDDVGLPRTLVRVLGWLVVCEPPYQSAQQIQAGLRLSAGSVSAAVNALARGGLVERVAFPGDRHTYYRIGPDGWKDLMTQRFRAFGEIRRMADRAMAAAGERPDHRLEDMRNFYRWCEELFTDPMDRSSASAGREVRS